MASLLAPKQATMLPSLPFTNRELQAMDYNLKATGLKAQLKLGTLLFRFIFPLLKKNELQRNLITYVTAVQMQQTARQLANTNARD